MWVYIILALMWGTIIVGWLVPVIKKGLPAEIYEAIGLGLTFSTLFLGLVGLFPHREIPALQIAGYVLLAVGLFFVVSAFVALKRRGRPETGWEETTVMIDSGVFGRVRHPLYLGTAITAAGFMLDFQSIPLLIIGGLAVFCCVMASKREDAFNTAKFGDAYGEYMRRVPMWNVFRGLRRR